MTKLDKFLIDATIIDEDKLDELLSPYLLGIDQITGKPYFKGSFQSLSSRSRIIYYLLALKVAKILGKTDSDAIIWSSLIGELAMPEGTVKSSIFAIKNMGLVQQDSEGKYYIPNHILHDYKLESTDVADESIKEEKNIESNFINAPFSTQKRSSRKTSTTSTKKVIEIPREAWEPYLDLLIKKGAYLERALLVLKLAKDSGFDGLTPVEIEIFFKETIRTPVSRTNISYMLGVKSPPSYTDRISEGKAYRYRIMRSGEEAVKAFIERK